MTEIKRKKGENFESYLRRFNRSLIKSQRLNEVRSRRYLQDKPNKNKQKGNALRSKDVREKTDYLRKIGKLKEEPKRRRW